MRFINQMEELDKTCRGKQRGTYVMKTLVIIFGTLILLVNAFILFTVLNLSGPSVRYRTVFADDNRFREGVLYFSEIEKDIAAVVGSGTLSGSPVIITESRAVDIVDMLIFSRSSSNLRQPYYVMHDEENRVFFVIAVFADYRSIYRVTVCQNTGGIVQVAVLPGDTVDIDALFPSRYWI